MMESIQKTWTGNSEQRYGGQSFAQHGDDLMIFNIFDMIGVKNPRYLDLGAHHPWRISNTALLYIYGARGVNIEANPNLIELFKKYRPEDVNVNVGVAAMEGMMPFYMLDPTSGLNSFSAEEIAKVSSTHPVRETRHLPVKTISSILSEYCDGKWPEFLNMDIEGMDFAVLEQADFTDSRPLVICVETRREQGREMKDLLAMKGYFCYCRMGENLIFVTNRFREQLY